MAARPDPPAPFRSLIAAFEPLRRRFAKTRDEHRKFVDSLEDSMDRGFSQPFARIHLYMHRLDAMAPPRDVSELLHHAAMFISAHTNVKLKDASHLTLWQMESELRQLCIKFGVDDRLPSDIRRRARHDGGSNRVAPPTLVLDAPGTRPIVCGVEKEPLSDAAYAVVKALVEAGPRGLKLDKLVNVRGGAKKTLIRLMYPQGKGKREGPSDQEWCRVILFPGASYGAGYRVVGGELIQRASQQSH